MRSKVFYLAFFAVLTTSLINVEVLAQHRNAEGTSNQTVTSSEQSAAIIQFKTFSYIDREGIGIEAFRMLIPSDWQFEGGIRWVLDNPGMPAVASFRVWNPHGKEEFEVFPTQPFFWTTNQMVLSFFPLGSQYFGNEVHPPVTALEALRLIVIPRFRQNVSNLRFLAEELLPELAQAVGAQMPTQPDVSTSSEGAKVRIEYERNGVAMEEEIYTVVQSFAFPIQTMYGVLTNINWYVDYIFSFKAEKGTLDAHSKIFQTIAYSFELDPLWFSKYNQVVEYLIQRQIQQIETIGQLSRIISQTSNEISDICMQSYEYRQQVNDRITDNFSQYIMGVDKYYNPVEERSVDLPSGYLNAWTNNLGDYVLSDNPNFDPNIGSNIDWQHIKRMR
jgi:hypothetical protein